MESKIKLVFIAVILSALVLGCTSSEKVVKTGDTVSVDYIGRYTNGTVFDTSNATVAQASGIYNPARAYAPFSFVVGANTTIKGFEDAVTGMKLNETKTNVTIPPEKAYGDYNASNVKTVPVETLTANNTNLSLYVGEIISFNDEYVYIAAAGPANNTSKVVYMSKISPKAPYSINYNPNNDTVTLDYNSPLAGKTLVFDITVVDIKTKA
ncbi:MAG TPA: peptidylprolyl isomerase [Methanocella sp.]|uniref:FKBP-type peptidyl-prolyl cis-trans isomerase n=1 Tax=Methanocella sp. TaxID=2052833 RepID=UPI002CA22F7C|nr:peptidylprolyl isomerase [Methanocella sp.]HTY90366.1 peptidylprolyl isomerase [Methanocella sp.]